MNKIDYEKIQTIQENTIKKLINYINESIKYDRTLDSIEFYYPDFDEKKAKLAFNVWISTDYRTDSGKSFIELMLDEKSNQLSSLEKSILIERNKSFISLFEINNIDGDYVYVKDLLTGNEHVLWEPAISSILNPLDLIFGRIGKIIDYVGFIGNISFLPPSIKDEFIGEIFVDYNRTRFKYPELTIDKYLKLFSVNVYRIYTECIYEAIDLEVDEDKDIASILYDELDEFEYYLQAHMPKSEMRKHITNLINLFEHYLVEYGLCLHDIDEKKVEELIDEAIKDGLISSQHELSSYISTLKKYYGYLKSTDKNYRKIYEKILEISKNRFLYIDTTRGFKTNFNINRNISNNISHAINENAFDFIMDYEKFLLYLISNPLEITKKKQNIKRKNLLELNRIMENEETITKKAPNQNDFTMLDFFYNFSIDNNLAEIDEHALSPTTIGQQFLRLADEEKYSLLIQYILSDEFLKFISKDSDIEIAKDTRKKLIEILDNLKEGVYHRYNNFDSLDIVSMEYTIKFLKYMKLMGLVEYTYYPALSFTVTPLGKLIFNILLNKNDAVKSSGKIIYIDELK